MKGVISFVIVIALCICYADKSFSLAFSKRFPQPTPAFALPDLTTRQDSQSVNKSLPESLDGRCGADFGTRCSTGFCCSGNNFCGVTVEHCLDKSCQPAFGTCGKDKKNKGFQFNTCAKENVIAITFDDGPRNFTHQLLDHLKEKNVKATFFMNGHAIQEHCIYDYADVVRRAYKEGHHIGAHTWSHLHLAQISEKEVYYQIETLEVAFKKIIGAIPTYFRPPFGQQNDNVQRILREKGYKMVIWDIDTNDFTGDLPNAINLYTSQINKFPQPSPHIILNHDKIETTTTTLGPLEVEDALNRGYKVTTVGDCVGYPDQSDWYRDVGKPQERDDTWVCTPEDMHLSEETPIPTPPTPAAAPAATPAGTEVPSGTEAVTPSITPSETTSTPLPS